MRADPSSLCRADAFRVPVVVETHPVGLEIARSLFAFAVPALVITLLCTLGAGLAAPHDVVLASHLWTVQAFALWIGLAAGASAFVLGSIFNPSRQVIVDGTGLRMSGWLRDLPLPANALAFHGRPGEPIDVVDASGRVLFALDPTHETPWTLDAVTDLGARITRVSGVPTRDRRDRDALQRFESDPTYRHWIAHRHRYPRLEDVWSYLRPINPSPDADADSLTFAFGEGVGAPSRMRITSSKLLFAGGTARLADVLEVGVEIDERLHLHVLDHRGWHRVLTAPDDGPEVKSQLRWIAQTIERSVQAALQNDPMTASP